MTSKRSIDRFYFADNSSREEILALKEVDFQTQKLRSDFSISSYVKWDVLLLELFEDVFSYFHEERILWDCLSIDVKESNKAFTIPLIQAANEYNLFKRMDLTFDFGGDNMELDLCPGINSNPSLEHIRVWCDGNWSEEQLLSLNNLLQSNSACLRDFRFSPEGPFDHQLLCHGLGNNTTLEDVRLSFAGYRVAIDDGMIANIVTSLTQNPNLQELELLAKKPADLSSVAMKNLLAHSSSLKKLAIFGWSHNLDIECFVEGLKKNRSLTHLKFGPNAFTSDLSFVKLFPVFSSCPNLEKLTLGEGNVTKKDVKQIQYMERLSRPIKLKLFGKDCWSDEKMLVRLLQSHPEVRLDYRLPEYESCEETHSCNRSNEFIHADLMNWFGRYLLDRRNIPLSLWALVFEKFCKSSDYKPYRSVTYEFLKGPAFAGRESIYGWK